MNLELGWGISRIVAPILYVFSFMVILLTLFKYKDIGIYFLVFFLPLHNLLEWAEKYPLGKDINDILLIALVFRWIVDSRKSRELVIVNTPFNVPILVLIIWIIIEFVYGAFYLDEPLSVGFGTDRIMALKNFIVTPLIFFILINNIKDAIQMKIIVGMMIFSTLLLCRNSINLMAGQSIAHYSNELKILGVGSALSGNSLAVFLAQYAIVIVAILWHYGNAWKKVLLSVPALLSYYVTLFLFSRSGYAAIAATGIFWGILKSRKVLILLIIVFLSYETLLPNAVKERIEMTKTEDGYDDTAQERFEMWKIGLGILQGNPILGAGFEFTHNFNINLEGHGTRTWHSFHNSYLQQAVETGIVGLGIYLFLFFLAVKLGWQLYNKTENGFQKGLGTGLMGATFACLAGNLAGSYWNFLNVMGYYWVLLALVIRCILNIEEQEKVPVPSIENQTDLKVKDKALKRPQRSKFNLKYL